MRTKPSRVNNYGAVLQCGDGSVCRFGFGVSVVRATSAAEIEASIRPHFREQPHGVAAGAGFSVDGAEFDYLDVVLKDLHPLFRRRRDQQLADVLPRLQEGAGIVADPLDRSFLLDEITQLRLDLSLLFFEPLQFRLYTGKPPRPEAFQHLDQLAGLGMDLGQTPACQVFLIPKTSGFSAEAGQRFLHDAVPRLDHPANLGDPPGDGVLQRFRRDAVGLAGVFATLVLLAGADVVVVHVGAAVGRCPDHMRPALAAKQAGERIDPAFRLLEVHVPLEHLADLELHAVELLAADDRFVAVFLDRVTPANLAKVDRVAEDADDLLLAEAIAAPRLV